MALQQIIRLQILGDLADIIAGIDGVICGRALYAGRIDPASALALVNSKAA